jgi:hypothetical protein
LKGDPLRIISAKFGWKFQRSSFLKLMNWLNPNCKGMIIGMFFAKLLFFSNVHTYGQFGFNHICSFWEEGIWTFSHRVQC